MGLNSKEIYNIYFEFFLIRVINKVNNIKGIEKNIIKWINKLTST